MAENALLTTFKTIGDKVTMSTPTGQSYSVKIDGPQAPYKGDPGVTTVSMKKIPART